MENEIPDDVREAVGDAVKEHEERKAKWREGKRAKDRKFRAEREAQGLTFEESIRPRQARFCHLLSLGLPVGQAYIEAGYLGRDGKVPEMLDARNKGAALLRNPQIKAYYTKLRESAYLANVLSLAEKGASWRTSCARLWARWISATSWRKGSDTKMGKWSS